MEKRSNGAAFEPDIDTLFFFEGKPAALSLYQPLAAHLLAQLPDMRIKVSKTQISFQIWRESAFLSCFKMYTLCSGGAA